MDKCGSWCQVWRVFHLFSNNHLSCYVNIKHRFNIIGVHNFISTFSFILPLFPMVFFSNNKKFPQQFFFKFYRFLPLTGLYFDPCVKRLFKGALSGLRQFLTTESLLKMIENAFYFTTKALFVLKIFKFLSWLFRHVSKRLD